MEERIEATRKKYAKNTEDEGEKKRTKKRIPKDMKICPFWSTPDEEVPCSARCALYRSGKQAGYECPLTELTSMSWVLKGSPMRGKK